MQGDNFNQFYGFGQNGANNQAQYMPQGFPWQPNFQNVQNQQPMQRSRFDNYIQQNQKLQNDFFVLVNGVDDVKNTLLHPNQGMWFRFQNDPYIAYKFANEVGTAETKFFEIREVDINKVSGSHTSYNESAQQQQFVAYIQGIEEKVNMLEKKLNEVVEEKGANEDVKPVKQVSQSNDVKSVSRRQQ